MHAVILIILHRTNLRSEDRSRLELIWVRLLHFVLHCMHTYAVVWNRQVGMHCAMLIASIIDRNQFIKCLRAYPEQHTWARVTYRP